MIVRMDLLVLLVCLIVLGIDYLVVRLLDD